jgi:hypothetical protein
MGSFSDFKFDHFKYHFKIGKNKNNSFILKVPEKQTFLLAQNKSLT